MEGLNPEQMSVVGEMFQEANGFCWSGAGEETKKQMVPFLINRIASDVTPAMMTPKGISVLRKEVFGNEHIRDYILKLSFIFFSRWAPSNDAVCGLCHNLSRGLSQSPYDQQSSMVATPPEIMERLGSRDDVFSALSSNPWLIVSVMIPLFISHHAFEAERQRFTQRVQNQIQ